jgi:hypothetical protein
MAVASLELLSQNHNKVKPLYIFRSSKGRQLPKKRRAVRGAKTELRPCFGQQGVISLEINTLQFTTVE